MRRLIVLLVLFGVMFALQLLRAEPVPGARDPMTLAAIGFVLLASFTLAELGSALTLPRVTGYILAGVALGPSVANVLSKSVVSEMRMFNALALGLIATGAGLELDVKEIAKVLRTLLATVLVKLVLGVLLVGGAFVAIASSLPSLGFGDRAHVYSLALVLGVLSVGTSPSIALAVKTESRARGRLTDLVLGAAVLKDLVVVVCLAVAVALARSWLAPGEHQSESVVILVTKELGSSLLSGAVLGGLLILYIRVVKAEMLLFVAAMILVVSEVGRTLHLELLLVFITAGFVVRNASRHEHELMPAVQMVALPVFIVFFTIAGASVDLHSTLGILPVALALAVMRAFGYRVASRIGGRFGRERALIRDRAWLGYLPQAGVTLGLVGLSAQQLPMVGDKLKTLGMAGVAINLLIGPIALKRVLKQAGETHDSESSVQAASTPSGAPPEADLERSTQVPPVATRDLREIGEIAGELESEALRELVVELHRDLSERLDGFLHDELEPWVSTIGGPLEKVLSEVESDDHIADALHAWSEVPHADDLPDRAAACHRLFSELQTRLRIVETRTVVPLELSNRKALPGDPLRIRFRKRSSAVGRLFRFGPATRRVPSRLVARLTLEARLAGLALSTLSAWSEAQAHLLSELERSRQNGEGREQTRLAARSSLARFLVNFERFARVYVLTGFEELVRSLAIAGGPSLPTAKIRLSRQEPSITRRLARLRADPAAWKPVLEGKQAELKAKLEIESLVARIRRTLDATVLGPAQASLEVASSVLAAARKRLSELSAEVSKAAEFDAQRRVTLGAWARDACPPEAQRRLALAATRFRSAATVGSVAREIRVSIASLPATVLVAQAQSVDAEPSPATYRVEPVELRVRVEEVLIETLFPALDEQLRQVYAEMAVTGGRIREAVEICEHALEALPPGQELEMRAVLERAFDRALGRLDEQLKMLEQGRQSVSSGVRERAGTAFGEITAIFQARARGAEEAEQLSFVQRFKRRLKRPLTALARLTLRGQVAWARLLDSDLTKGARARYQRESVDAVGLEAHLARFADASHLPRDYARLWRPEPVRKHALFTANRDTLQELLATERSSLQGRRGSALLVGRSGSGRTSLLNLCEVELSAPRVIRPEPIEWRRSIGIVRALAVELGLGERVGEVGLALKDTRTTVLIDDLEQWFTPDAAGIAELARFLELVVTTDSQVFWLVAAEQSSLALLEEALPIKPAFTRVIGIPPLSVEKLGSFLEGRHGISGRAVVYPKTAISKLLRRFGFGDARGVFLRMLARSTEGNISAAVLSWLRAAHVVADGSVELELKLDLRIGPSMLAHLSASQLAILSHLTRFGPFDELELARYLELSEAEIGRHAHFFLSAGVLARDAQNESRLSVVPRLKPLVLGALRDAGITR